MVVLLGVIVVLCLIFLVSVVGLVLVGVVRVLVSCGLRLVRIWCVIRRLLIRVVGFCIRRCGVLRLFVFIGLLVWCWLFVLRLL